MSSASKTWVRSTLTIWKTFLFNDIPVILFYTYLNGARIERYMSCDSWNRCVVSASLRLSALRYALLLCVCFRHCVAPFCFYFTPFCFACMSKLRCVFPLFITPFCFYVTPFCFACVSKLCCVFPLLITPFCFYVAPFCFAHFSFSFIESALICTLLLLRCAFLHRLRVHFTCLMPKLKSRMNMLHLWKCWNKLGHV